MREMLTIIAIAYLIGSIPFGVLLARAFRLPDPRTIGSGNIGATNMLRTGNRHVALLTLLLDAGKGAVAAWVAYYLFAIVVPNPAADCAVPGTCMTRVSNSHLEALALTFAALGHMFSPWLKFSGGKAVATILGGALAFSWPVGAAACGVWLLVFVLMRYVSLASLVMMALIPFVAWLRVDATSAMILAVACALAIYKHRGNIARLRAGTELKLGRKS